MALVKLAARAFYNDITLKGDNQPKSGRNDNRGMAVVILDALTRRQWVREEDLAKDLKLHLKQLRRTLRFFEEEKLITRDHRKESAKGAKMFSAAVAATRDVQQSGKDGEEKMKMHTHSYCSLDYAQTYDIVRYRLHRMKKKLKDELENRNTIQEYICPPCARSIAACMMDVNNINIYRYSALDALQLISPNDEYFHCEKCDGELVAESDKLAAEEMGDGDDNARRRRREKLKDMLQKMEVYYKYLLLFFAVCFQAHLTCASTGLLVLSALSPDRLVARPGLSPAHISLASPHGFIRLTARASHRYHKPQCSLTGALRFVVTVGGAGCESDKTVRAGRADVGGAEAWASYQSIGAQSGQYLEVSKNGSVSSEDAGAQEGWIRRLLWGLYGQQPQRGKTVRTVMVQSGQYLSNVTMGRYRYPERQLAGAGSTTSVQLKPLVDQLARVKDLPVPEFGSLLAWEARANAAGRVGTGDSSANDPSKSSQGQGFGGAPMPYLGETRVEVALSGVEVKEEDTKPDPATTSLKVLPPWMIKQGMKLTKEQLGEVEHEDNKSASSHRNDEKKPKLDEKDEENKIQDEYIKAYYAALAERQKQHEESVKREQQEEEGYGATMSSMSNGVAKTASERQIGMKVKREEGGDDDVEWEAEPIADDTKENNTRNDPNAPVDAAGEDDDEIDWEEG
ncbi:hypothetical protein ACLOJK_005906 [Asimina triloba]